ncbi:MAG: DUF547 domain-containing protein [Planctomycetota bacterium]
MLIACSPAQQVEVPPTSSPSGAPSSRPAASRPASGGDHAAFDELLARHVRDERVDYDAWRRDDAAALEGYLQQLAEVEPASLARAERLAFYINLYNATMIREVLDRLVDGYSPAADDFAVFKAPVVALKSGRVSLNHLENEIIRPDFGDPRIHVALVCAARSCPPILPRAYVADDLDEVLDANMRRFVADPSRNRVDHDAQRMELSKIFEWYADDFGGAEGVAGYVAKYLPGDRAAAGYAVTHSEYSWTLNLAAPAAGG